MKREQHNPVLEMYPNIKRLGLLQAIMGVEKINAEYGGPIDWDLLGDFATLLWENQLFQRLDQYEDALRESRSSLYCVAVEYDPGDYVGKLVEIRNPLNRRIIPAYKLEMTDEGGAKLRYVEQDTNPTKNMERLKTTGVELPKLQS